ncbi:MAG: NnrU family protein [Rhodospirillales bacterium]|jgi:uncharacterized membrane protein|nr:NnrU family protein [Rhodospirillales bacterium]MDP6645280.1 NnrU family protein [Rhodospirillales bacterium]MDP6842753.1 NnrU family protein [Rhodospirillales bacterium]|tara:strand:- start:351 stop:995 length:645 start_codon:yes stop_codon:yes gene_type:complete
MTEFLLSVAAFIAAHVLPAFPRARGALVRRLGERTYLILYSGLSLALLIWLGFAFQGAPVIELWPQTQWARWLPALVMAVACPLLIGGLFAANPFSLTFSRKIFDADRPGLIGLVRHPVFWATGLWAAVHIPVNGEAVPVILFSLLLLLSLYGPRALAAKRRKSMDEADWRQLTGQRRSFRGANGWPAGILGGGALYLLLLYVHQAVIGVSPWP